MIIPFAGCIPYNQLVPYEAAAKHVCESLGWLPTALVPILDSDFPGYAKQKLHARSYGDGVEIQVMPATDVKPRSMELWVVVALYICMNRAVLQALHHTGNPAGLIPEGTPHV